MQTAPLDFRLATRADEDLLIALMREFYAEDRIDFDDARVRRGVDALLANPRNGEVLLWLDEAGEVVGYAVIAMGFSLEQGGHFMLLDELYLSHRARGRGRGKQALAICEQRARGRGVSRLRLEVNHHNELARRLYLASGYIDDTRDLLTLPLDHPRPEGIL
ncbi:GNAT family N-acetyltransferase [Stenotrophomonas maltophilia]|uniref:GNAT family N-acetyltransferase n=1 Tax=Stenotrophomonas maltophilia TaxID=40324 RepID=UPI00201088A0|nr:GNAT family N-acetyltransferase [Stenotrophomonas maltophilia]ELF4099705.1 GNAT family N-acetyltransferase [Stenotrophomonas maltophilia]UQA69005.1 GNAT family N-acetyltransferase [Stenotrophomonas maltophilia]WQI19517.1 GNAT family N-acetyltransferase [Stenotrophomonas maltophilia]